MQWLELHNVEYGECIVLGGSHHDILMVDCGSINQKIREGDLDFSAYVDPTLMERYSGCSGREFLLTHYHRDHLCGLYQMLSKRGGYFDRILLPVSPADARGQHLLLDFALFVYAFLPRQSDYAQVNLSALRIFSRIAKSAGADRVYPIAGGSSFLFDGVTYEVLWPDREGYPFSELFASAVEQLNVCLASPFLPEAARRFLELKARYGKAYDACCQSSPLRAEGIAQLDALLEQIDALLPELHLLPTAPDVVQILTDPGTTAAYSDELNAASVIFHNRRTKEASLDDILMTGDAAPESFDAIAGRLYRDYYIVKAPHHGTASHWSHWLSEIAASHILISNGEYQKGGKIASEYVDLPAVKHCTNCVACSWYASSGCSCNRVACCYDLPMGAGLTIKCPRCRERKGTAPCGIYIVSHGGERACLCDDLPVQPGL